MSTNSYNIIMLGLIASLCRAEPSIAGDGISREFQARVALKPKHTVHEFELLKRLTGPTAGYTKLIKPLNPSHTNNTLIVKARMYVIHVQDLDESTETLHTTLRLQLNWRDPMLAWSPQNFGGIKEMVVPKDLLWLPYLQIANGVDGPNDMLRDSTTFPARLHADGNVWYHPTGKAVTRCNIDLKFYPFDVQQCSIIVESAIYQDRELRIMIRQDDGGMQNAISLGMLAENDIWEILPDYMGGYASTYKTGERTAFSRVQFFLRVRRRSAFYIVTAVVPTALLSLITLLTYLVPVHYVDRPNQSVTTVLAVAMFEIMVAEKLPKNSANCYLTIYLTVILCAATFTILITTICLAIVDPGKFITAMWGLPQICNYLKKVIIRNCEYVMPKHQIDETQESPKLPKYPIRINGKDSLKRGRFLKLSARRGRNMPLTAPESFRAELGRRLSRKRSDWYLAYAVNWTGFAVCAIFLFGVPFVAAIDMSFHDAMLLTDYEGMNIRDQSNQRLTN